MRFEILTLFPDMFAGPLGASILKRGMQAGYFGVRLHNIRDYTHDKHHVVDDYPYGGGAGMVMKAPPVFEAVESVLALPDFPPGLYIHHPDQPDEALVEPEQIEHSGRFYAGAEPENDTTDNRQPTTDNRQSVPAPVILLSPAGRVLTQELAAELAQLPRIVLVCGHYEGLDERVRQHLIDFELSIGDYVLTGGELAAMVVVDAVARLQPGVLAEGSAEDESHTSGLLEYPHYTRPAEFRGWTIPDILTSGHHANVAAWRRREALRRTLEYRPDMLAKVVLNKQERKWLDELRAEVAENGQDLDQAGINMNSAVRETTETARSFDGTLLAFHTWAPQSDTSAGPIALIHHGVAFHGGAYARLGRLLAGYGIPALAIDARGHGLSEGKRGDLERSSTLLSDLAIIATLWRERYPDRPLIMIGESMGGLVALLHAYQAQDTPLRADALVLSAPGLTIHPHKIFNINTLSAVPAPFAPRLNQFSRATEPQATETDQPEPASDEGDQLALSGFSANYIMVVAGMSVHSPQAAAHIEIPTLIVHGKKDELVPYQGSLLLHYLIAAHDKEIELYPEDGHTLLWSEEGAPVFDRLLKWIARHFPIAA